MTKPTIKIHNAETGEIVEREMNAKELEQYELDAKQLQEKRLIEDEKIAARTALLTKLGITAEEAALLLG